MNAPVLLDYLITAAAGERVAGRERGPVGSPIRLTEAEARYELLLGTIVPPGTPVPPVVPEPPIKVTDNLRALRGVVDVEPPVGQLFALLMSHDLSARFAALSDRIDEAEEAGDHAASSAHSAAVLDVRGGVASGLDTLKKLADALSAKATPGDVTAAINGLLGGAGPAYDTLKELQDLITADEGALSALTALVGSKAAKGLNADIARLSGADAAKGVDLRFGSTTLASAATVELGAADTVKVEITGSVGITSFGTVPHLFRLVTFGDGLTVAHDPAKIILPGAESITFSPGDMAIVTSNGTGVAKMRGRLNADGSTTRTRIDVVTASSVWTKPAWAKTVDIIVQGGGGGGGSGRRGATGTVRAGGGGGGAGGMSYFRFLAEELPGTLSVNIGAGAAGGAAVTTNDTNGSSGGVGGTTSVVNSGISYIQALGGYPGGAGGLTGGGAGTGGSGESLGRIGNGGVGSSGVGASQGLNGIEGAAGGGGGGGISAAENATVGAASGYAASQHGARRTNPAAGGAVGAAGAAGNPKVWARGAGSGGGGGGAGAANGASAGGAGGIGGAPAAGGGGGGGATNGAASGAGGDGARGEAWFISQG